MKGRAAKRHRTRAKIERAKHFLRRYGFEEQHLERRAKKFADSRWGCNCHLCMNRRKLGKGKTRDSVTRQEWQALTDKGDDE